MSILCSGINDLNFLEALFPSIMHGGDEFNTTLFTETKKDNITVVFS